MTLIDKDTLSAEIEKLIANGKEKCQQSKENNAPGSYIAWSEHIATCGKILSYINTLKAKDVNLEKEVDAEWNKCNPVDEGMGCEFATISIEQFYFIAKYFFELGLKTQKGE